MSIIQELSSDDNELFSPSQVIKKIPARLRPRLAPLVPLFLERLKNRGIIVAVDRFPRYRLVGVDYIEFGSDIQHLPSLTPDQVLHLQNMAILARMYVLNGFDLTANRLLRRLSREDRAVITPQVLNDFLDYMDILDNIGTINDVLFIVVQNLM